ncbi:MAG: hypothetical protein ACK515_20220 [bacterium]
MLNAMRGPPGGCASPPRPWWLALVLVSVLALPAAVPAAGAVGIGIERSAQGQRLDRSIRRISLSHHVIRIRGLAPICPQMKRVLSMNVRYADLDGDNAEEAVVEAVTCQSKDGSADLVGVYKYQLPDSVRELPTEHAVRSADPVFAGAIGPLRLELIDGRLVRWFAIEGPRCPGGKASTPGRRSIVYRWGGSGFVVDRIQETAAGTC